MFLINAHRFLDEAAVEQAVWNLRDEFKRDRRTLVLLAPDIKLPLSLQHDVFLVDEAAGPHDQLATRDIIDQAVAQIGAMREAVGPKIDICLDVNVNFKPSEALLLARELEPFKLFWMEIDNQDADALVELHAGTRTPLCGGEQLQTVRQYRPYLECHALDTIMVDVCWQGFSAAKKVADLAETHEINVAPHNYNGHLSSFQALNFVASVSNVKIMESDPDAAPIRDDLARRTGAEGLPKHREEQKREKEERRSGKRKPPAAMGSPMPDAVRRMRVIGAGHPRHSAAATGIEA